MKTFPTELHRLWHEGDTEAFYAGLQKVILDKCRQIARRYPEAIYNNSLSWDEGSFGDLASEVYLNKIKGEEQDSYIMAQAKSHSAIEGMLVEQIRRVLKARAGRGPVERLIKRVRDIASGGNIKSQEISGTRWYSASEMLEPGTLSLPKDVLRTAARKASRHPILPSNPEGQRETMLYQKEDLIEVVKDILGVVDPISEADLRGVFDILLTPWLPVSLSLDGGLSVTLTDVDNSQVLIESESGLQELIASMKIRTLKVMVFKSQGLTDDQIAQRLNISRPTVIKEKENFTQSLTAGLTQMGSAEDAELVMPRLLEIAYGRLAGILSREGVTQ
jgi:hypothetical protein